MIKALQWIQELLCSWSRGARQINRTSNSFTLACRHFLVYSAAKGPQQLGGLKKKDLCAQIRLLQIPAWGREQMGTSLPSPRCLCCPLSLGSSSGSQPLSGALCALLGQHPEPGSGCSAQTCGKRQLFPAPTWYNPNDVQAAGMIHNKQQGEGKQISNKIFVNKRLMKSLLLLSLAALDKSLQTRKQK